MSNSEDISYYQEKLGQWFFPENLEYVESLFQQYLQDPLTVDSHWRKIFDSIAEGHPSATGKAPSFALDDQPQIITPKKEDAINSSAITQGLGYSPADAMSYSYRCWGHLSANIDPLQLIPRERKPELELPYYNIDRNNSSINVKDNISAYQWYQMLNTIYCGDIGVEFEHIQNQNEKDWLYTAFESMQLQSTLNDKDKRHLLKTLCAAENLEKHLASRYPGTKRFGIEGAESLIPLLEQAIQSAGELGAQEIVLGMPHRGRLNVLVNIMGKNAKELFAEFEGKQTFGTTGDVKYHQGFSSNVITRGGEVHIAMSFNPSHLEIVAPVVIGSVRARQERRSDTERDQVVPIVLHGDAAFAGQGVVMETFQMSQTRAYKVGGAIHIIINNQIGFTTNRQDDARSTLYCTEVAKIIQAPIFHINSDNPEKVIEVMKIAMAYRYQYKKDVIIDLVCYRRRGHNETDEPSSTQPQMYRKIREQDTTYAIYLNSLIAKGVVSESDFTEYQAQYRQLLDKGQFEPPLVTKQPNSSMFVDWAPYLNHNWDDETNTTYSLPQLIKLAKKIATIPEEIQPQAQVQKIYLDRLQMAAGKKPINWGMAELLSYASLAVEGYQIRLSGQDSQRGTFSHRHSAVLDQQTGRAWRPLSALNTEVSVAIYDSLLSEEAVLGFEYGYSSTEPNCLVLWEGQFGDFVNGAQVVIDQFIASAEHKWSRMSGLTLLLPHGYEGQGPEHSSARLERFLQLCAEQNMQICIPTTPSQIFHLLRLQMIRKMRRPLIIFSPKMLLRHKNATSTLEQLATGQFEPVLVPSERNYQKTTHIILCSGKIYYHILEEVERLNATHICIIRLEQLYPFPEDILQKELMFFKRLRSVTWCQEEPINQGAWYTCNHIMRKTITSCFPKVELKISAREASSAPACGYMKTHIEEQKYLISEAINTL